MAAERQAQQREKRGGQQLHTGAQRQPQACAQAFGAVAAGQGEQPGTERVGIGGQAGPGGVTGYCLCQNAGATDAQVRAMTPESELGDFEAVSASSIPTDASEWETDVLDPAILRPGRFDRQVVVPNPDVIGRERILKVHIRKVPLAPDVDLKVLARGTPGFSGADLMNLVNEGALLAARRNKRFVTMAEFEDAKEGRAAFADKRDPGWVLGRQAENQIEMGGCRLPEEVALLDSSLGHQRIVPELIQNLEHHLTGDPDGDAGALGEAAGPGADGRDGEPPADGATMQGVFEHLERELDEGGFFHPPEKRPSMVRNLRIMLGRANFTDQEAATFHGIVAALSKGRGRLLEKLAAIKTAPAASEPEEGGD